MRKYVDLIDQTFEFPNSEFSVEGNYLSFNGIPLIDIIKEYGTPAQTHLFAQDLPEDRGGQ